MGRVVSAMRIVGVLPALVSALLLSACGEFPVRDTGPGTSMNVANTPDPVPRWEPRSRYGNNPTYVVSGITYKVLDDPSGYVERGLASWYGQKFHGQYTSSREVYNMYGMSAAHRSLPLPTYVRVTNLSNGRSCIVRVNDRGPFHSERLIDLSYAAASKLGIVESGTAMVEVRAIDLAAADEPPGSAAVVTAQPGFRAEPAPVPVALPATPVGFVPVAEPTPATPVATSARLYVQVGAFASRENAERLRARLSSEQKLTAQVQESGKPPQKVLYLVRVGPVASDAEAERLLTQLQGLGVGTPRIIRNP